MFCRRNLQKGKQFYIYTIISKQQYTGFFDFDQNFLLLSDDDDRAYFGRNYSQMRIVKMKDLLFCKSENGKILFFLHIFHSIEC